MKKKIELGPIGAVLLFDACEAAQTALHRAAPSGDDCYASPEFQHFGLLEELKYRIWNAFPESDIRTAEAEIRAAGIGNVDKLFCDLLPPRAPAPGDGCHPAL